jgi:dCMP deaminase
MDTNRIAADEAYMQMAEIWALRSYATRSKVGALLVVEQQIISDGFNGMPRGMPNEDIEILQPDGTLITNPLAIHAEANCFDKLSKNGSTQGAEGGYMYLTLSPCVECAKRIINNKVAKVFYRHIYRNTEGLDALALGKVPAVHLPRNST